MKEANNIHRRYHKKKFHLFRSWWSGVIIITTILLVITIFQYVNSRGAGDQKQQSQLSQKTINFGVALGAQLSEANNTERLLVLNKIKNAGFTEVRISLEWNTVESVQGKYDWTHDDNLMKAVKKVGLKTILLANSTPAWARLDVCKATSACPPQNPMRYAEFMATAVNRYKTFDVSAWEIWNEENGNNFWMPQPNPIQYTQLLKASYTAIKKVNHSATVLVGGLSGDSVDSIGPNLIDPRTYLTKLYAAGAGGFFDGLAYHPYITDLGLPTKKGSYNGWAKMNVGSNSIRSIMIAHNDASKGVWITEFGIPTGGTGPIVTNPNATPLKADHASLAAQAQLVQAFMDDLKHMPWVRDFDWYSYKDGATAAKNSGAAYGIWEFNDTPKPMLKVLQTTIQTSN